VKALNKKPGSLLLGGREPGGAIEMVTSPFTPLIIHAASDFVNTATWEPWPLEKPLEKGYQPVTAARLPKGGGYDPHR
jgi:hypothetical protein